MITNKHFETIMSALAAQLESKETEIFCLKYDIEKLKEKIKELEEAKESKK